MAEQQKVAVYGLGSMGYGMAKSCIGAGMLVYGIDMVAEQIERLQNDGAATDSVDAAADKLDTVLVVVLNAEQTESVLFGDNGIVNRLKAGAVVIACATVAPSFARDMQRRCSAQGVHYLDAPISGGSIKASAGQLSVMASGTAQAFAASKPVLNAIAEKVFELGDEAGAGSAMKAVNQMLAGVHIATMAEALTFGMTQGVTPDKFLQVISQCAGSSWMLENRAPHIIAGDYKPLSQINIWPKDLGIVLDIAKSAGFSAPITETALQQYMLAVDMDLGTEDDAAIAKVYASKAGLELPGGNT